MSTELQRVLKARFAMVRQDLDKVLAQIGEEDLSWAPREGMRTIGGLLEEIETKDRETLAWLRTGHWPDEEDEATDNKPSLAELKSRLSATRADTIAYLDSLSEAELMDSISCPERWWEALRLTECPRSEVLRNVASHEWYHTGQMVSYLWMRADDPFTWEI